MKGFRNIFALIIALLFVASCSKEVIVPAGQSGNVYKKSGQGGINNTINPEDLEDDSDEGIGDNEITDPENDLDFD